MKKFRSSPLLPWRQASFGMPCRFPEYAVLLDEMRAEDQTELIEGKHRESVFPPKERKDAFRDLGHD
jgi:hypothetical protein